MAFTDEREYLTGDPGDEQNTPTGVPAKDGDSGSSLPESTGIGRDPNASLAPSEREENLSSQAKIARNPIEPTQEEKIAAVNDWVEEAKKADIPSYNGFEIQKKFPATYKALVDFMTLKSGGLNLDEDTIIGALLYSPRAVLFNFFDSNGLFLNIAGSGDKWQYTIVGINTGGGGSTRTEAEVDGFTKAFSELERKLNNTP